MIGQLLFAANVLLSWQAALNSNAATTYRVYRSTESANYAETSWVNVGTAKEYRTTTNDDTENTFFVVTAIYSGKESVFSNEVFDAKKPSAPTSLNLVVE